MSELFDLHKKYDSIKVRSKYPYSFIYTQEIYPRYLDSRRNEPLKVLEIGICYGGALQAMRDYLPNSQIIGYDKDIVQLRITDYTRIQIMQGSQDDPVKLQELIETHGPFDIIIDDACHQFEAQRITFETLWPHVKPRGLFFIEDVMSLTGKRGDASSEIFNYIKANVLTEKVFTIKHWNTDKMCISFYPTMIVLEKMKERS